jgi:general stress protein 26
MQANQQLTFLQEKIDEIKSAIFFNLSDSVLKLPTSIVSAQKVDEYGFVWFFMQKPRQDLREFDKEFPVRLDFFRKGKHCFLQVTGKAWVVMDPEEINTLDVDLSVEDKAVRDEMILVKVKMLKAEYHETQTATSSSWWQSAVNNVYSWFRASNGSYGREIFRPASLN